MPCRAFSCCLGSSKSKFITNKIFHNNTTKSLPWLVNGNLWLKIVKFRNIFLSFLSQYCV